MLNPISISVIQWYTRYLEVFVTAGYIGDLWIGHTQLHTAPTHTLMGGGGVYEIKRGRALKTDTLSSVRFCVESSDN